MNNVPQSSRRIVLLTVSLMFMLVLICGGMGVYILSDKGLQNAVSWTKIAVEVEEMYPGQLDWEVMFDSAMGNMLHHLDRYSSYVEPQQFERMDEELTGSYGGIGVTVIRHRSGLLVMSVRENGPAHESGILAGDVILEADSISLVRLSISRASSALRGKEGTSVVLTVLRPVVEDTLTIRVTRRQIDLQHIPYAGVTPDSVLYIRLLDFNAGASSDIEAAIDSLLLKEKNAPLGIILDLRGNPGGLLSEAYQTADLFLDRGQLIVGTDSRSSWNEVEFLSSGDDITGGLPMAVIVDRGSASAAEIVAGALGQLGRAFLVGDTTFGKGLVQGFTRFQDGSGLRLTISRYYLEGGLYLNEFDSTLDDVGHGLVPDYLVEFAEYEEFPRKLENSLLLQRFANQFEEEIILASGAFCLSDDWVLRFEQYANDKGFRFVSRITRSAQIMLDMTYLDRARISTTKSAGVVLRRSKSDDRRQFTAYSAYIKMRLRQIAYERKYGIYRTYDAVITRERREIQLATQLLLEKRP
jgi:C-terminal peptidase prc